MIQLVVINLPLWDGALECCRSPADLNKTKGYAPIHLKCNKVATYTSSEVCELASILGTTLFEVPLYRTHS